jgi:hypothetical protein
MITLTCGHNVWDFDDSYSVCMKEYDRENKKVLAFKSVCFECKEFYKKEGLLLNNTKEEQDWLMQEDLK